MNILWITFWKVQKYTCLTFRKSGNSWNTAIEAVSERQCFPQRFPLAFSFHSERCGGMRSGKERNIRISSGALWNLSCPSLPTLDQDSDTILTTSSPSLTISLIMSHCCSWEWLHLSGVLEERKWIWTIVLQIKSKILCLLKFSVVFSNSNVSLTLTFFSSPH